MIARSAFIAFGPASAWAQVIGNMVIEFIVFVLLIACRPHKDKKGDWLAPFLSLIRLIAFGLLVAFIPSLEIDPIIRTVLGIVEIAVFGIPTILLFFGLIWNAGYGYLWRRHTHRIEDGLEVERFVAEDDDSQTRTAMTNHVDANNFVSGHGQNRRYSGYDANGNDPSLQRRTSMMEPVDTTYSAYGNTESNRYSRNMYDQAANGRHLDHTEKGFREPESQTSSRTMFNRPQSQEYTADRFGGGQRDAYLGKY